MGDETQIHQLFQNLIDNALKYHPEKTHPNIHVYGQTIEQGTFYQVTMVDNGIGIEPTFFEQIFEPFQRLHNQAQYRGSGVGLTICKKIMERHGGKIQVESTPGSGSKFVFCLPTRVHREQLQP